MDIYERIRRYEQSEQLLLALRAESSDKLAVWMSYGGNIKELEESRRAMLRQSALASCRVVVLSFCLNARIVERFARLALLSLATAIASTALCVSRRSDHLTNGGIWLLAWQHRCNTRQRDRNNANQSSKSR